MSDQDLSPSHDHSHQTELKLDEPLQLSNGTYDNPWSTWQPKGFLDVIHWKLSSPSRKLFTREQLDKCIPVVKPDMNALKNPDPNDIQATWIGLVLFCE